MWHLSKPIQQRGLTHSRSYTSLSWSCPCRPEVSTGRRTQGLIPEECRLWDSLVERTTEQTCHASSHVSKTVRRTGSSLAVAQGILAHCFKRLRPTLAKNSPWRRLYRNYVRRTRATTTATQIFPAPAKVESLSGHLLAPEGQARSLLERGSQILSLFPDALTVAAHFY